MAAIAYEKRMELAEKLAAKIEQAGGEAFTTRTWGDPKSKSGYPSARVFVNTDTKAVAGLSIGGDGGLYLADVYTGAEEEVEQLLALLSDQGMPLAPNDNTKTKAQPDNSKRAPRINL
jgi:hypothetical protein